MYLSIAYSERLAEAEIVTVYLTTPIHNLPPWASYDGLQWIGAEPSEIFVSSTVSS
jgi:hypothetical protein